MRRTFRNSRQSIAYDAYSKTMNISRREFLYGTAAFAALPPLAPLGHPPCGQPAAGGYALAGGASGRPLSASTPFNRSVKLRDDLIDNWDTATGLVEPKDFFAYMRDGDTRGLKALAALERAFEKVMREAKKTVVKGDAPAVWSVYNMGYVVKTRESLFTIDIKHRRDEELVPSLDFALVTHNHGDHFRREFCKAMDAAGKPLVSSFVKNAAFNGIKAAADASGSPDEFKIRDVKIRTFRIDHAAAEWGIDFTTAFEMHIGDFRLLHTGDCGVANDKLRVKLGRPDLWLLFPMSSLDVADAVRRIQPKRCVFGHLWELGHAVGKGRAHKWHIYRALPKAQTMCGDTTVAFWGDRII